MAKEIYHHEKLIFSHFKALGFDPRTIFDIGSAVGGWSGTIVGVFPSAQFHLFEPLADLKPSYKHGCDRFLGTYPNFSLHKIALGDRDGTVTIYSDSPGVSASVLPTSCNAYLPEKETVPIARLLRYADDHDVPRPDLVKIDVQGGEMLVLKGAGELLDTVQVLQAETWLSREYGPDTPLFHELLEFLENRGLQLFELGDRFYTDAHRLYAMDAFFLRSELLTKWRTRFPATPLGTE
jgi:FkbM family methyltransferase